MAVTSDSIVRPMLEHPFLRGLLPSQVVLLLGCASQRRMNEGERIFREGDEATEVFLVRSGGVALEAHGPRTEAFPSELRPGDAFGWGWIVPGYRWPADGRAIAATAAIVLDAECVRRKCRSDASLGFQLATRFIAAEGSYLSAASADDDRSVRPIRGNPRVLAAVSGLMP